MDSIETYVGRYSLIELLSPDLAASLRLVRRSPGELLIRSGDELRDILFFVEGRAKSYSTMDNGQSVLAAFSRPFDVFGEAELFSAGRYTLSVEAVEPCACLALPAEAIRKAVDRNGRLLMYLCARLGSKLSSRIIAESINLRYPVENRLASYLLAAADGEGRLRGAADLSELADFIGASYRQLARVLRRLRDEGILDGKRGLIRVLDRARLEPYAVDRYPSSAAGTPELGSFLDRRNR
jgi:CRP/FNR family transcriptional regulator, putaive post-exponential-phase nitrogen-starvation regulator